MQVKRDDSEQVEEKVSVVGEEGILERERGVVAWIFRINSGNRGEEDTEICTMAREL